MEPRLNIVTLGVEDLERAVSFYKDGLGWALSSISAGDYAIFKISTGTALALFPRRLLAEDACVEDRGGVWKDHSRAERLVQRGGRRGALAGRFGRRNPS